MKKLRLAQTMMVATIFLIVAFQVYYIQRLYNSEWKDLKKETDVLFRETVYKLQVARFKKDTTFLRRLSTDNVFDVQAVNVIKNSKARSKQRQQKDSPPAERTIIIAMSEDSLRHKEFPEELRVTMDSLAAKNKGQFRIITSRQENRQVQIVTHNRLIDSHPALIQNLDTTIKKKFLAASKIAEDNVNPKLVRTEVKARKNRELIQELPPAVSGVASDRTVRFRASITEDPEIRIFSDTKSLNDSLPISQLDSAYKSDLKRSSITVPFLITKTAGKKHALEPKENEFKTNAASVGLLSPYHYQATFESPFNFLIKKIAPNIILSILLVGFTIGSFIVLYRNLIAQRRLADIKNEFISNITHELKTPIATVNVAIEAMKSFNALHNPERTKEYLDISQSELQRLSLLVDKVLRLSMFENKEIEFKKEWFDVEQLVKEVTNSMKLQFEKKKAQVSLNTTGDRFQIEGDRLHITSVVYNLLDNALKYSNHNPEINIEIISHKEFIEFRVRDNGIGIATEYKSKVFEQFFRVPNDNRHNTKGYGLGLSYVNHVVQQHHGFIEVESELGKGSTFTVKLPYKESSVINFDNKRRIIKEI